ncbi:MAG: hypothetical protein AUK55_10135 [Syntrophobacteraceae bacterium CG2_30_61_12]|nr:MAG: hypothetical protein AUK55_10135 [Syntrophobacteraceae bacterium CG2_30_61_12]
MALMPAGGRKMSRRCGVVVFGMLMVLASSLHAAAPLQIAGFALGAPIEHYRERLKMDTALPLRHEEYLSEVEAKDLPGFKNGYLVFGTCLEPHKIVKIRLKYADSSKSFFNQLLQRFEARFGKPTAYRGDAFQTFIAWKWSFTDQRDGSRVSMILQHYSGDDDEYTNGNSVKLTWWSQVEAERLCDQKKTGADPARSSTPEPKAGRVDFDFLVPK